MQYIFYRGPICLSTFGSSSAVSQSILGFHWSIPNGTWKTSMLSAFSLNLWKSSGSPSYESNDLYQSQYFGLLMYRHHLTVKRVTRQKLISKIYKHLKKKQFIKWAEYLNRHLFKEEIQDREAWRAESMTAWLNNNKCVSGYFTGEKTKVQRSWIVYHKSHS